MKFWWRETDTDRQTDRQTDRDRHRETDTERDRGLGGWTAPEVRDTRTLWKHDMQKQVKQGKEVAENDGHS